MSAHYVAERILKPAYFSISRLIRGRGSRSVQVIGFDSEQDTSTNNGRPMLFQFSTSGEMDDVELLEIRVDDNPLDRFMSWVHANCTRKDTEYIILGWNLQYEWTQIFGHLPEIAAEPEYELGYTLNLAGQPKAARYTIRVANDKRFFAKIRNESTHRTITVADGMAFYVTSLDNAAKILGLGRKVVIGSKRFTRADLVGNPLFTDYAKQDAYLTRKIGENILDLHETYDVTTCLTAPQFASKVFRHHFLQGMIPPPDPDLEQAGLWSYHGGKNGYYLGGPKSLANVYAYDITSAYPEAMRQLPDPERSEWHWTLGYEPGVHAVWNIRAKYVSCTYHGLMQHGNSWHETGDIEGWVTSYELDAAIALGEVEIVDAEGWVMRGPDGGALVEYVDTFFEMKRKAKGAMREAAKLFLNSLYGKFFQKVPLGVVGTYEPDENGEYKLDSYVTTDPTQQYDWQAGGLYHPPIASLITGFVRAKIHKLEHKYGAIMTSTDGFFAIMPPDPADVSTDLGGLTVERGHLRIWRERLYVFTPSLIDAIAGKRRRKLKYALHGFRGKLRDLVRMPLEPGKYEYQAQAMITNKLARNAYHGARYAPGVFVELPFTLDLSEANAPP